MGTRITYWSRAHFIIVKGRRSRLDDGAVAIMMMTG
jgi:hypothetical protein